MDQSMPGGTSSSNWFVGSRHGDEDQTARFVREGIWEYKGEQYLDLVRSMQPGDRIAIKSCFVRRHGLKFDNRGHPVSVMQIKASGTITEILKVGERVRVSWTRQEQPREWYFYTHRAVVWRVKPGQWTSNRLLEFAFDGVAQDINRFVERPYWRDRYHPAHDEDRFPWTRFYEEFADRLLEHRKDRSRLIEGIHRIAETTNNLSHLKDKFQDGSFGPLQDICPFTVMATFNRGLTDENRRPIAGGLATLLGVKAEVPESFEGVPQLIPQMTGFFPFEQVRSPSDIDDLWNVFAEAKRYRGDADRRQEFVQSYDTALKVTYVGRNLSTGLHWANPWDFPSLDKDSRKFLANELGVKLPDQSSLTGARYLELIDEMKVRFWEDECEFHSFPGLSRAAKAQLPNKSSSRQDLNGESATDTTDEDTAMLGTEQAAAPIEPYSLDRLLEEGCFLEIDKLELLLERLKTRKNLILQGPPGTGKTWTAKRLAYALMEERDDNRVRAVQFHPNLSYEDFVRGWRPVGEGRLAIADGMFLKAIRDASNSPTSAFVVVIEEINRGDPARIFGEMLTLLEADKRSPNEALEITYPDEDGKHVPVHIPENLHVIGTMNIADRSLAFVDLAFRRRFAFVTLEPVLGERWREWVVRERGVDPELVKEIGHRMERLNDTIAESLGNQFRIGHSYVTPTVPLEPGTTRSWFRTVAETEIGPLLDEYWFDAPKTAEDALQQILKGW